MVNWFSVEYQIQARIADRLPEIKAIYSVNDGFNDAQIPTPAIIVSFQGDVVTPEASRFHGATFTVQQRWCVSLYLPARYTIAEVGNAGNLVGEITRILHGWVPDGCTSEFTRTDAQPVERSDHYIAYHQNFVVEISAERSEVY
jgi:hypothetical protein